MRDTLFKHSAQYLLASGLPGIINFLAIALYTRVLSPDEYGRYALVIAGVGLSNVIFFQWLRLSLSRFMPAYLEKPQPLLSTILASFSALAIFTGSLGLLLAYLWPDPTWRWIILLAVPLLWSQAWFELNLSLMTIKLLPLRYGLINGIKAGTSLAIGTMLIMWGKGTYGPLIGLLLGMLLASVLWGRIEWKGISLGFFQPITSQILRYGLPISATFALAFVISSSDRFLIAWFFDEGAAGLYAAAYDFSWQTLTLLMMVVNLAAYPLAVRALEQKGTIAAQQQLYQNAILLLAIAVPSATGMAVLAPNVSTLLLGPSFRENAAYLMPWVALAILLAGIRSYYFDLAFQLGRHTLGQVWVVGMAALLNIILNIWWIPQYGLMGAAYSTIVAYLMALILSAIFGRHVFLLPIPYWDWLKIVSASLIMVLSLSQLLIYQGLYALIVQVLVGGAVYFFFIGLFNVGGYRDKLLQILTAGGSIEG